MNPGNKHIHFIGIGGIGMSGLAEYYLKSGWTVSGSDLTLSDITERLQKLGAKIYEGHSSQNISSSVGLVVYTSAVDKENPELEYAGKTNLTTVKRSKLLADIVNDKFLIAVSGTHGKTTTTAMIGTLLSGTGFDPLVFVGGNVPAFGGSAYRYGEGKYAVVEADEYDRSFLELTPDIAVITNIDEDHLDIYKDLNDIIKNFKIFCENGKTDSEIVYCGDDSKLSEMVRETDRVSVSYGFASDNFYTINNYVPHDERINFSIRNSHNSYPDIAVNTVGKHNALNSAACFAVAKLLNIGFNDFKSVIGNFRTVNRRLQLKYNKNNMKIYDDYAHHPKEISSGLSALKNSGSRIIAVFQPHLYTRTRDFYNEFASELSVADQVILTDIYPAREKPIKNVSSKMIYDELVKKNKNSRYLKSKQEIISYLLDNLKPGDTVVFQGAGTITELCGEFVDRLNEKQN